jgi:hypothetical protein
MGRIFKMTKLFTNKKFDKPTGDFTTIIKTGDKLTVDFGGNWISGKFVKDDRVLKITQHIKGNRFYAIDADDKQYVIYLMWHKDNSLWDVIAQSAKQYSSDAMVATTLKRVNRRK